MQLEQHSAERPPPRNISMCRKSKPTGSLTAVAVAARGGCGFNLKTGQAEYKVRERAGCGRLPRPGCVCYGPLRLRRLLQAAAVSGGLQVSGYSCGLQLRAAPTAVPKLGQLPCQKCANFRGIFPPTSVVKLGQLPWQSDLRSTLDKN